MREQLVIIVPGVRTLSSWKSPLRRIIEGIAFRLRIYDLVKIDYTFIWRREFKEENRKAIILHWSRLPELISIKKAEKKLLSLIKKYSKKYDIFLIGISLGGKIVFEVIKNLDKKDVRKVFLVASPCIKDTFDSKIPIINFFSDEKDKLANISYKILCPLDKGLTIKGKNVKNIKLNLNHREFCLNEIIKEGKFRDKTIIGLIKENLK